MSSPNLGLETVATGVLQPSVPINDALQVLDALVQPVAQTITATPPTTVLADAGKRWIIDDSATGVWSGKDGQVALCTGADLWRYFTPTEGWRFDVLDVDAEYRFDGSGWLEVTGGGTGSGDVAGPGSAVADRIAAFDGTTGKLIKDGGKTIADLRAPAVQSVTSSATVTPTFSDDLVNITAQAAGLTLANPTGSAIPALGIVIRIKDNGTARAISYGTQYRALGVTLPTTTTISKTTYLGMIYNSADTKWDVVSVATEA